MQVDTSDNAEEGDDEMFLVDTESTTDVNIPLIILVHKNRQQRIQS